MSGQPYRFVKVGTAPSGIDWVEVFDNYTDERVTAGMARDVACHHWHLKDAKCGTCGHEWCFTCYPTPASRCPKEAEHEDDTPRMQFAVSITSDDVESGDEAAFLAVQLREIANCLDDRITSGSNVGVASVRWTLRTN